MAPQPRAPSRMTIFRSRIFTALVCLLILGVTKADDACADLDIEFILDASASMAEIKGGVKRLDAARDALLSTVAALPSTAQIAVRVYGHRESFTNKDKSCSDSELIQPLGAINFSALKSTLSELTPRGSTSMAYALSKAKEDFNQGGDRQKVIILLSDGEETCGGDPAKVVRELISSGFKVKVHTLGFSVNAKASKELNQVAAVSGGRFESINGPAELKLKLSELVLGSFSETSAPKKSAVKSKGDLGAETDAGATLAEALPISATRYVKNYLDSNDTTDIYKFEAKVGEKLFVTVSPGEKDQKNVDLELKLFDKENLELALATGNGDIKSEVVNIVSDDTYYLSVRALSPEDEVSYEFTLEKLVGFDP